MTLTYNISRDRAAFLLWVSTRTLDRYIRKGLLSYTKKWNRVLLSEEEVLEFREKMEEEKDMDIVLEPEVVKSKEEDSNSFEDKSSHKYTSILPKDAISKTLREFVEILKEKDKQLEEKNKVIFMLNRQIGELENKLSNMIALPDYTKEKEKLLKEKEKLELEKKQLEDNVVYLKIVNILFVFFIIFLVVGGLLWAGVIRF